MNLNEKIIIILIIAVVCGILWYKYDSHMKYINSLQDQIELENVNKTNIHGDIVNDTVGPNMLDKDITDSYDDELGFPEPAGKGIKNITPDESLIRKYYSEPSTNEVPLNNKQLPIGTCAISKPMSRDLPVANAPMCLARQNNSDMRLRLR